MTARGKRRGETIEIFDDKKTATHVLDQTRKLAARWFGHLEHRLAEREWIALDEFSVADIALASVLRTIRQDERTRLVPVVMLTSSAEENDIVRSYELGVNSYIVKPVEFDKFVEEVSKLGVYWAIMNRAPS